MPPAHAAILQTLNAEEQTLFDLMFAADPLRASGRLATIRDLCAYAPGAQELPVLLVALFFALEEGSLCLRLEPEALARLLRRATAISAEPAGRIADRLTRFCLSGDLRAFAGPLLATDDDRYRPLFLEFDDDGTGYLFFQRGYEARRIIRDRAAALSSGLVNIHKKDVSGVLAEVIDERPIRNDRGEGLRLTPEQREAVETALVRPFMIITGGPGTGKTSTIVTLLRALARLGFAAKDIYLAAPTGRAAQRMTESVRRGIRSLGDAEEADAQLLSLSGKTLHRLLRYHAGRHSFMHGADHPLPPGIVIVDEVSMVDAALMARLLEALDVDGGRTRLILIGDRDQLPSVEAGAVLADFLRGQGETAPAVVELRSSHRSGDAILHAARAVNAGDADLDAFPRCRELWPAVGCHHLAAEDADLKDVVHSWLLRSYDARYFALLDKLQRLPAAAEERRDVYAELFGYLDRSRMLTLTRRGASGFSALNRRAQLWLSSRLNANVRSDELSPGTPVMITRNDPRRDLYNGDVGLAVPDGRGRLRFVFELASGDQQFRSFLPEMLHAYEPAFALTVHKSQGSEYGEVLFFLPEQSDHPLLNRRALYTALTRAKKLAVVYGDRRALEHAARERMERETGAPG